MKPRLAPLALVAVLAAAAHADDVSDNANLWIGYFGDHPVGTNRWGIHFDTQARLADMGDRWQQVLARPGLNYSLTPSVMLSAGYCFIEQFPYGEFTAAHPFPIHAAWQQVAYTHPALGLTWLHRARLEQRWIGRMQPSGQSWDVADYRHENRLRSMLRASLPLTRDKNWYIALSDEIFLNFGGNVRGNDFDQNRASIALGRNLSLLSRAPLGD